MDTTWSEFLEDSLRIGRSRSLRSPRNTFVAMPEGPDEKQLTEELLRRFQRLGFRVLDIRATSPGHAIRAMEFPWPKLVSEYPGEKHFSVRAPVEWDKIVIVGGSRFEKAFWKY